MGVFFYFGPGAHFGVCSYVLTPAQVTPIENGDCESPLHTTRTFRRGGSQPPVVGIGQLVWSTKSGDSQSPLRATSILEAVRNRRLWIITGCDGEHDVTLEAMILTGQSWL